MFISDEAMKQWACVSLLSGGSRFGKGDFMHMYTVATTPPFDVHAHRVLTASNCRTVSLLLTTLVQKGVSMETVETPLDLPLLLVLQLAVCNGSKLLHV